MSDHRPVLVDEVLEGLGPVSDGWYVDATYGRGGHCAAILERLAADGRVLALDKDPEAVAQARRRFAEEPRFEICHADFTDLGAVVTARFGAHRANGILFDLGVSSPQLDAPERGFSFSQDGPLDMRMNSAAGITLAQWLAEVEPAELGRVIAQYGEQPGAWRIAAAIVAARSTGAITRTGQLADIVARAAPRSKRSHHPATRVFQALRIALNDELGALRAALRQSLDVLAEGGRLVVISFHSLEDRIVKRFMAEHSRDDPVYAGLPDVPAHARAKLRRIGRLVRPGEAEIAANPRARSARLRIAQRCGVTAEAT
ncbi:MAG: 16S rRNA (cytosine(1402)-N(4))-methyltransferase RsmH [Gammaproteobacteria bacterium]|jgi:16S rRNA (cytosine1402-N4)-methyltransferase